VSFVTHQRAAHLSSEAPRHLKTPVFATLRYLLNPRCQVCDRIHSDGGSIRLDLWRRRDPQAQRDPRRVIARHRRDAMTEAPLALHLSGTPCSHDADRREIAHTDRRRPPGGSSAHEMRSRRYPAQYRGPATCRTTARRNLVPHGINPCTLQHQTSTRESHAFAYKYLLL